MLSQTVTLVGSVVIGMATHTEDVCVRCDAAFAPEDAQVTLAIESADIGCFRNVEKTHVLCGECYTDYLTFVFEDERTPDVEPSATN